MRYGSDNSEQVLGYSLTQLEHEVLGSSRLHRQHSGDDLNAVHLASLLNKLCLGALHSLSLELLDVLLHCVMLFNVLADNSLEVLGVIEEGADGLQAVLDVIEKLLTFLTGLCLDTADAGGNAALRDYLEETDTTG